jgi:hypothetical protein
MELMSLRRGFVKIKIKVDKSRLRYYIKSIFNPWLTRAVGHVRSPLAAFKMGRRAANTDALRENFGRAIQTLERREQ